MKEIYFAKVLIFYIHNIIIKIKKLIKNTNKNINYSTLSNKFPNNTNKSYVKLNLKTTKYINPIFDINIAIKNFANYFALILFIVKVYILVKRKQKIEKEFLSQIPGAEVTTGEELPKIPKFYIDNNAVWPNYAGYFKYNKRKKNRKHVLIVNTNDEEANKFIYNELLLFRSR